MIHHITKLDNSRTFFDDIIDMKCYCEVILYPFIGHLIENKIVHRYLQPGGGDCTHIHTACVSVMLLHNMFKNDNFEGFETAMGA
jgi:hypothetical protein